MRNPANKIVKLGFSVATFALVLAYPVFSFLGINYFSAAQFALAIMVVFILRSVLIDEAPHRNKWPITAGIVIFCSLVIAYDSEQLLKYYPVLMNAGFGLLFLNSLRGGSSFLEQLLKASGKPAPAHAAGYLRYLSGAWGVFLILNAMVSAFTACCMSDYAWALYNGLFSYVAIATFVIVELIYRQHYKRRHGIVNE